MTSEASADNQTRYARLLALAGKVIAHSIVIGLVIALTTAYFNFRATSRAAIDADFTLLKNSSNDLNPILAKYSARALKGAPIDEDTATKFQTLLLTLRNQSDAIAKRDHHVAPEADQFVQSLLKLRRAADAVTGPLNGKSFVEATAGYLKAENDLKGKISERQSSFF